MIDTTIESAVREGLAEHLGEAPLALSLERRIGRPYSEVLFFTVPFAHRQPMRIVVKRVDNPGENLERLNVQMRRDFRINQHLHRAMRGESRLAVPTPLLFRPDLHLIVTEFMPGERLHNRLVTQTHGWPAAATLAELAAACEGSGAWLRAFQAAGADLIDDAAGFGASLDTLDARGCVEDLEDSLRSVHRAGMAVISPAEIERIVGFAGDRAAKVCGDDARIVPVHGDFCAGNVLHDGERTVALDFVMFRKGMRLLDLSYFMFQLDTLAIKPTIRSRVVQGLQAALLRGYGLPVDPVSFWHSSPAAELLFLTHSGRRLWGMAPDGRWPLSRRLYERWMAPRTARTMLEHVREAA